MLEKQEFEFVQKEWESTEIKVRKIESQLSGLVERIERIEGRLGHRKIVNGRTILYDAEGNAIADVTPTGTHIDCQAKESKESKVYWTKAYNEALLELTLENKRLAAELAKLQTGT